MAEQDNNGKMAIPFEPKDLARKLVRTDISGFVVGKDSKEGIRKFTSKQPTLRHLAPNADENEQDKVFKASAIGKEKTTRRADYETDEDITAYEETSVRARIVEKATARFRDFNGFNAQKAGALVGHGKVRKQHERSECDGADNTAEPPKDKEWTTAIPPQVLAKEAAWESDLQDHEPRIVTGVKGVKSTKFSKKFRNQAHQDKFFDHEDNAGNYEIHHVSKIHEAYLYELGEPMSPSPATSDNPGQGSDASLDKSGDSPDDRNKEAKNDTDTSDSVREAKDLLEQIALCTAEMFENIPDDMDLADWCVEKLTLAQDFVSSVSEWVKENSGGEDNKGDGENEGESDAGKSKPDGSNGNQAQMSMKSESRRVRKPVIDEAFKEGDKVRIANPNHFLSGHSGEISWSNKNGTHHEVKVAIKNAVHNVHVNTDEIVKESVYEEPEISDITYKVADKFGAKAIGEQVTESILEKIRARK